MTPQVKTCFKCGGEFPLSEFYKHPQMADKHLNKCKNCTKIDVRKQRKENKEKYRAYDKARGSRVTAEKNRVSRHRHPLWVKAHNAVARALRKGTLQRQPCEICGSINVHAHHSDYSEPLDVIWLCPAHHRWIHG